MNYMAILNQIQSHLTQSGLTWDAMALASGIPRRTLARIITRRVDPKLSQVQALATALDLELVLKPCKTTPPPQP